MFKKILYIIWSDLPFQPLRLIEKSYARYKRGGVKEVKKHINREYYALYPQETTLASIVSSYEEWIQINEKNNLMVKPLQFSPLISIIVPIYNTDKKYLIEMIESVLAQTYKHWELCIADDASSNQETIEVLKQYKSKYKNIKVIYRKDNGHISKASNSALELAIGEYVAFLDHDDTLAPNALYEIVKKINENRDLKLIYTDEDKIDENGVRYEPHFKSGWNPDMFLSQNYICHLTCIKKDIVDKIGRFRVGYEGSQDYDLFLRCITLIDDSQIGRVEKILYHWRAIVGSTALESKAKNYTHDAGYKALVDYISKIDKEIKVEHGKLANTYKVVYPITNPNPLVSILIPTRDGYDILYKCIESILDKTTYENYEILILDNETTCDKTLNYFEELERKNNIKVLNYPYPFNYSAINNFGVKYAKGEILALVNNDIEVISPNWLTEMVSHAILPDVGAVGAMLYYSNGTIQHAGVILGIGGVAGHSHKYFQRGAYGYFSRLQIVQNYSAVTGACLVVEKRLYEEVGGLNEVDLKVAFNDVDFCLKLLEKGYRNVWTPYAELYHHESISRGSEDTPKKKKRFKQEILYMQNRWKKYLKKDNFYNKNLTLKHENFGLRED